MKKLKKKDIFWLLFLLLAIPPFLYFTSKYHNQFMANLVEIDYNEALEIEVTDAYNEHGIYILNDKYSLRSNTPVIKSSIEFKDNALLRFNDSKFTPSISSISTPYKLFKAQKNDTLKVIKGNDVVLLKMDIQP